MTKTFGDIFKEVWGKWLWKMWGLVLSPSLTPTMTRLPPHLHTHHNQTPLIALAPLTSLATSCYFVQFINWQLVMMIMTVVHIMPIQMAPFWHFDYKQLILVIPVEAKMQRSSWSNQSIFGFQSISTFSINLGLERKISWVWTPASQADHMHHNFFISNFMIKLSSPPSRPRFKSL